MNKTLILFISTATLATVQVQAQGAFQNMNFEGAKVVIVSYFSGPHIATTNALPGWSAFVGTNEFSTVSYNQASYFPAIQLEGSNGYVLSGAFSVLLGPSDSTPQDPGFITQHGLVPSYAESLRFEQAKWNAAPFAPVAVSLDGQDLTFESISNAVNSSGWSYSVYAADISAFAGQTATLTFAAGSGWSVIDDIQFSSQPIPEPPTLSLICFVVGVAALLRTRRPNRAHITHARHKVAYEKVLPYMGQS